MSEYVFRIDEPIECCAKCPFVFERHYFDGNEWHYSCLISKKEVSDDGEKAEDCPLVELPQHGRLIDLDRIIENIKGAKRIPYITSVQELIDYLEIYADLDKFDHTIILEASKA